MTSEEFVRQLPPYVNEQLKFKPPFVFKNLSLRVFPLRASLDALQQVCNNYLNVVPPEVGCFRAVAPYVYLALLDYGEISEVESSLGWFAQTEVYFGVPVEWYQVVAGKWTFRDWAVITPFIFVDDDFSVPLGRMVFGFPKTLARVTKTASDWLRDPAAPVTLARVKTMVFPELYKGRALDSRVFLEVERDAPMSNFRVPFQAASPIAPWIIASRLAEAAAGFGRDAMSIAQSMRIFAPNPWADPAFGGEMLNRLLPAFAPGGTGFTLNTLNLKQFRNSSNPDTICYQALTNGRMEVVAFNAGGTLGEECTSLGDLTGGYTIKLHDYSSLPITRTLGLEVHRRWRGEHGVEVVAFKPVMPFWANLNVKYLAGTNLAWRTHDGTWRSDTGAPLTPGQGQTSPASDAPQAPAFNTAVTSAVDDANVGPFEFKDTTIRVLPLLARRKTLQEFLERSINDAIDDQKSAQRCRLSVWARHDGEARKARDERDDREYAYVYMTTSSIGPVTSKTNNIGDWAKYELSFLIPVKWESWQSGEWQLEGVGLVPAFTFVDGTLAAISRTEVLGIPTLHAKFKRPSSVWLEEGKEDLDTKQTLFCVEAEVYTALHAGQSAAKYPLIEVSARDFAGIGEPDSGANPAEWAAVLRSERDSKRNTKKAHGPKSKIARALALALLGNPSLTATDRTDDQMTGRPAASRTDDRVPVCLYTLKQIRDVADPGKACYQSLVRVSRVFDEIFDLREINETLRVRLHEFPSLKLVERLGIVARTVREEGAGIVYGTQAIRPFYIRATIHELHGECLLWRAGTAQWENGDKVDSLLSDGGQPIKVDLQAERVQDQGDPCQMTSTMRQSIERRRHKAQKPSASDFISSEIKKSSSDAVDAALKADEKTATENADTQSSEAKKETATADTEILQTLRDAYDREVGNVTRLSASSGDDALPASSGDGALAADSISIICTRIRGFQEDVREWRLQLRKPIKEQDAKDALDVIDPQSVIESILSREWGNRDVRTKWCQGRLELQQAGETMLGARSVPFAKFHLTEQMSKDDIEKALGVARKNFAAIEQALYTSALHDQSTRPGWSMRREEISAMIDRMGSFTELRLKMNDQFSVLVAWSIAPTLQDPQGWRSPPSADPKWIDAPQAKADVVRATKDLLTAMTQISDTRVIGTPSQDEDPKVQADLIRLHELLGVLSEKATGDDKLGNELVLGRSTKIDELFGDRPSEQVWLIDVVREAVRLAAGRCDVQRDALLNKLSRAYQKPDFCVRRDSVDPATREKYFPRSDSWDEDWF